MRSRARYESHRSRAAPLFFSPRIGVFSLKAHPKFRLLGTTAGIVDGKHARSMGAARLLFDYLVAKQYDGGIDGAVNYGRALTVEQIRSEIPNAPPARTIRRHISCLRSRGYIRTHRTYRHGLRFWILNQKKFQLPLPFSSRPEIVTSRTVTRVAGDTVEKPVEMLIKTCELPKSEGPLVAAYSGSKGPQVAEQVFRIESIKERKSADAARRIVTACQEIERLDAAILADDGLPDRRVDVADARAEIRRLELEIDQAIEDRRKAQSQTSSDETPKPEIKPPATSPAFEQMLLERVEDGPGKAAFIDALRQVAGLRKL